MKLCFLCVMNQDQRSIWCLGKLKRTTFCSHISAANCSNSDAELVPLWALKNFIFAFKTEWPICIQDSVDAKTSIRRVSHRMSCSCHFLRFALVPMISLQTAALVWVLAPDTCAWMGIWAFLPEALQLAWGRQAFCPSLQRTLVPHPKN